MTDFVNIASTLLMHTGSRHVNFDLTEGQRKLIQKPFAKMLIMFGMFYISTRSVFWSIMLIGVYFVAINVLLNEQHPFNIFSKDWLQKEGFVNDERHEGTTNIYLDNLKALP